MEKSRSKSTNIITRLQKCEHWKYSFRPSWQKSQKIQYWWMKLDKATHKTKTFHLFHYFLFKSISNQVTRFKILPHYNVNKGKRDYIRMGTNIRSFFLMSHQVIWKAKFWYVILPMPLSWTWAQLCRMLLVSVLK